MGCGPEVDRRRRAAAHLRPPRRVLRRRRPGDGRCWRTRGGHMADTGWLDRRTGRTLDDGPGRRVRRRRELGRRAGSATAARSRSLDDAAYVLSRTRECHGFDGASSMERLPTEARRPRAGPRVQSRLDPTPPDRSAEDALMPRPYASAVIPAPVEQVWEVARRLRRAARWHPAIEASSLDSAPRPQVGAVRRLTLGDGGVVGRAAAAARRRRPPVHVRDPREPVRRAALRRDLHVRTRHRHRRRRSASGGRTTTRRRPTRPSSPPCSSGGVVRRRARRACSNGSPDGRRGGPVGRVRRLAARRPRLRMRGGTRVPGAATYPGDVLVIRADLVDEIVAHARRDHPDEACGVVAGPEGSRPARAVHPHGQRRAARPRSTSSTRGDLLRALPRAGRPRRGDRGHLPLAHRDRGVPVAHRHRLRLRARARTTCSSSTRGPRRAPDADFRSFRIVDGVVTEEDVSVVESYAVVESYMFAHTGADDVPDNR